MSYRRAILCLVVLLGATLTLQADVAPFPSWRVVTNGAIAQAVQAGDAIYFGGSFTKIGRGITPFDGVLDPVSLTFSPENGCARQEGRPVGAETHFGRYLPAQGVLEDGAGPFPVPANTILVKVGPDCRFDRRFRTIVPGNIVVWRVFDAGASAFVSLLYYTVLPITNENSLNLVVELDGQTGAVRRYWQQTFSLNGVGPDGRLIASRSDNGTISIGWFDTTVGDFVPARAVPGSPQIAVNGAVVVLSRSVSAGYEYTALDAITLTPLPAWPEVIAVTQAQIFASANGRVFMAGRQVTIDGAAAPHILAFDATTGARVQGWAAPAWMSDSLSTFGTLHVAAGRLLVIGDFAPGAPRDTIAALNAATGALDPWDLPFAVSSLPRVDSRLHFSAVSSTNRITRDRLAAVDASTGTPLPWTAGAPSPPQYAAVTALDADIGAGYLYAGGSGAVRRYGLLSGALDPSWQLDLAAETDAPEAVSVIVIDQGRIHVAGSFYRARDGAAAPWQPREGAAAMTAAGMLTPWRPGIEARCIIGGRFTVIYPCIGQMGISEGRVFLQGSLQRLDAPAEPRRSVVAVTADTGALDPIVPFVPLGGVTAITAGPTALFAATALGSERQLARVDTASGARLIVSLGVSSFFTPALSSIASRDARLYADVERDEASGLPTGNPVRWRRPIAVGGGMLDIEAGSPRSAAGWHAAAAPVAPAAPTGLVADLNGDRVTVRWSPGAGDLRPLVAPPPAGGTAPTSHVISVSLAPGGPAVAQLDTGSPDTDHTVVAPPGTYYVHVQAVNASGTSLPSEELRVEVRPSAPESPIATLASGTAGNVRAEWQAPPHGWPATGYLLEAGSSPGATDIGVVPVSGLEFHVAGVPPGRYYLRVRAVNANGTSAPGEEVAVDVSQ